MVIGPASRNLRRASVAHFAFNPPVLCCHYRVAAITEQRVMEAANTIKIIRDAGNSMEFGRSVEPTKHEALDLNGCRQFLLVRTYVRPSRETLSATELNELEIVQSE